MHYGTTKSNRNIIVFKKNLNKKLSHKKIFFFAKKKKIGNDYRSMKYAAAVLLNH
jgi:hypothetical protein